MNQVPDKEIIQLFFRELSALLGRLNLAPCDIWVAGSYARNEQKAEYVDGRILSSSDLELLVVAQNAQQVRSELRKSKAKVQEVIDRHFRSEKPLDFGYWVVSRRRFKHRPCVLFYDAILAGRRLHAGMDLGTELRQNRYLMRDSREILIHRAANQALFRSNSTGDSPEPLAGAVITRNILDLLTVHFYVRGIFLPSYSARVAAIDEETRTFFGAECAAVFERCLNEKLYVSNHNSLTEWEIRELEGFFSASLKALVSHTSEIQREAYMEDSLNYSGLRTIAYRLSYVIRRPGALAIRALFTSKQRIVALLHADLEYTRTSVDSPRLPERNYLLTTLLLANYPYLRVKIDDV